MTEKPSESGYEGVSLEGGTDDTPAGEKVSQGAQKCVSEAISPDERYDMGSTDILKGGHNERRKHGWKSSEQALAQQPSATQSSATQSSATQSRRDPNTPPDETHVLARQKQYELEGLGQLIEYDGRPISDIKAPWRVANGGNEQFASLTDELKHALAYNDGELASWLLWGMLRQAQQGNTGIAKMLYERLEGPIAQKLEHTINDVRKQITLTPEEYDSI